MLIIILVIKNNLKQYTGKEIIGNPNGTLEKINKK